MFLFILGLPFTKFMNTVQKNNTITKKQVQELVENNQVKLGLSDKNHKKAKLYFNIAFPLKTPLTYYII